MVLHQGDVEICTHTSDTQQKTCFLKCVTNPTGSPKDDFMWFTSLIWTQPQRGVLVFWSLTGAMAWRESN